MLGPADDRLRFEAVLAPPDWGFEPIDADAAVWGRGPASYGEGVAARVRRAVQRERALDVVRRHGAGDLRAVRVHRWRPPSFGSRLKDRIRSSVMSGALVELGGTRTETRLVDACTEAAGIANAERVWPSGSGAILAKANAHGATALLRTAREGSPGDPAEARRGLEVLRAAGVRGVPLFLGGGSVGGASWSLETWLDGGRPTRLTAAVVEQATRFAASLPRTAGPPTAPADDLGALAAHLPAQRHRLASVQRDLSDAIGGLPGVLRHGDFRGGNLLYGRGGLSGVIDWDAWHPSGAPGADLLHLLGMDEAVRRGLRLGANWVRRPWRSDRFARALAPYWRSLDVTPDGHVLDAVAMAWWAAGVRNMLDRLPGLAEDEAWHRENVNAVLDAIEAR